MLRHQRKQLQQEVTNTTVVSTATNLFHLYPDLQLSFHALSFSHENVDSIKYPAPFREYLTVLSFLC